MIRVREFQIDIDNNVRCDRHGRAYFAGPVSATASLRLVMDEAGIEAFFAAMEAACPGFREQHAPEDVPALTAGVPALPYRVVEAELED